MAPVYKVFERVEGKKKLKIYYLIIIKSISLYVCLHLKLKFYSAKIKVISLSFASVLLNTQLI